MNRTRTALIAAGGVMLLAACSQPPLPEDHFYRLETAATVQPASAPTFAGVVEVSRFAADGVTAQRPIVYSSRGSSQRVRAYHYHFWVEPPTIMLQNLLASRLRAGKLARSVVTPDMRVEPDFVISGRIKRLEQVTGGQPAVVVEVELALKEMRTERLVHVASYKIKRETSNASVDNAVRILATAVDDVFTAFLKDAERALR